MPRSMARSQAGPVECRSVGIGCGTDHHTGWLLNGRKSTVLPFGFQADLAMGQALFVTSYPSSLVVRLNSPLPQMEPGAGWKYQASGSAGYPTHDRRWIFQKSLRLGRPSHVVGWHNPRSSMRASQHSGLASLLRKSSLQINEVAPPHATSQSAF